MFYGTQHGEYCSAQCGPIESVCPGMGNNHNLAEKLMLYSFSLRHVTSTCDHLFLPCQFPSKEREIANLIQNSKLCLSHAYL